MTQDIKQDYKNCVIYHIEEGLDLDRINEKYKNILPEIERRNIVWHVISLYMPDVQKPQPRKCGCGKG